jgi:hypothetical protein
MSRILSRVTYHSSLSEQADNNPWTIIALRSRWRSRVDDQWRSGGQTRANGRSALRFETMHGPLTHSDTVQVALESRGAIPREVARASKCERTTTFRVSCAFDYLRTFLATRHDQVATSGGWYARDHPREISRSLYRATLASIVASRVTSFVHPRVNSVAFELPREIKARFFAARAITRDHSPLLVYSSSRLPTFPSRAVMN